MDPITLGLLMAMGAGGAAALVRLRRRGRVEPGQPQRPVKAPRPAVATKVEADPTAVKVGDVLLHLGESYWLAGELSLQREGAAALRVFCAPEKGRARWVALPRQGDSLYLLDEDEALRDIGWPGVELVLRGRTLRALEQGSCAVAPRGEVPSGWEGVGRYAVFRALETVAVVIEQGSNRIALSGKMVPRALVERLGT